MAMTQLSIPTSHYYKRDTVSRGGNWNDSIHRLTVPQYCTPAEWIILQPAFQGHAIKSFSISLLGLGREKLDVPNRLMECLHSREHPKTMDLLYQGWAVLFNSRGAGAWFGSAVTQVSCQHQLSSTDTANPSLTSGNLAW